jgi:hypothetical protein
MNDKKVEGFRLTVEPSGKKRINSGDRDRNRSRSRSRDRRDRRRRRRYGMSKSAPLPRRRLLPLRAVPPPRLRQ